MKVKELIKLLKKLNQDYEVILSKDSEGNSYSPACNYNIVDYKPENTYYGEIYDENHYEEDPEYTFHPNAIVLYPTN
jgi:hypothetical protein